MEDTACARAAAAPDGDATLQVVLSFLDAHDAADAFGETSSESVASPSQSCGSGSDGGASPKSITSDPPESLAGAAATKAHRKLSAASASAGADPPRTAVRSDKRQREEMIALREESLALQDRLEELKGQLMQGMRSDAHPNKKRAVGGDHAGESKEELRRLRAQAWQAVTEAQQKRREAAEAERERLRGLIDQQKKSFRQLRRYLVRHAEKHKEFGEITPKTLFDDDEDDTANESSSEADDVDFDEISRAIPTMLLQTGALFTDSRLDSVITSLRDLKVQNEESHKMTIEALESSVVPFDVTTTANAVWQHHLTKAHRKVDSPRDRETLEITDSSIRRAFKAAIDVNGSITRARGRMETRRYVETNRVVIVQSSIMDRIEFSSVPLPNFAIRHFQWTVIEPPRNSMLRDSGKHLSQVEIYGVNVPTIKDMHEASFRDAVKRGCIEAVNLQLEFERQSVENILMQNLVLGTHVDRKMLQKPQW